VVLVREPGDVLGGVGLQCAPDDGLHGPVVERLMNRRIAPTFSRILRARLGKLFPAIFGTWKIAHE
jgi:hypothetical protein